MAAHLLLDQKVVSYPSQDSSIGSILACHRGGPGFKSRQGREFLIENKLLDCSNLNMKIMKKCNL